MRIKNIFTEGVVVRAECASPERLINELARLGVDFNDLSRDGNVLRFTVNIFALKRAARAAEECAAQIETEKARGVFYFITRMKKRYVLTALSLILLVAVFRMSSRIWEIRVSGNSNVQSSQILEQLQQLGIGIGTDGTYIDNQRIRSEMLERIRELSWLTVQINGSRAEVIVRERRAKPEIIDRSQPADVIAAKTGLIEKTSVLEGKALVKKGDMVLAGQTLITGELSDLQGQERRVRALGEVWARTWYRLGAQIPLEHLEKNYTGDTKSKISVKICNLRLNLYFDSGIPYMFYDKISSEKRVELFGLALPLSIIRSDYIEYEPISSSLDGESAEKILKQRLLDELSDRTDASEVTQLLFETDSSDRALLMEMTAECLEQIGLTRFDRR